MSIKSCGAVFGAGLVAWAVACGGSGDSTSDEASANQPASSGSSSGGSSGPAASSSGSSSGMNSSSGATSSSGSSSGNSGMCTAGSAPGSVTETNTTIRVLARGEGPPAATGGNPEGVWAIDKSTLLLPSGASGLVRLNNSKGKASGFAEFKGGNHRIKVSAVIDIAVILGGPIHQVQEMDESGTFKVSAGTMDLTPNCASDAGAGLQQVSFAVAGGRGTIVVKIPTQAGDAFFVLEGPKT